MSVRYAILLLLLLATPSLRADTAAPYDEKYRPQYHFSPKQGWMGDPDGLIRYDGTYHLFWWGHAESKDLVFWKERPRPMRGDDGSFTYYTGSVVVDEEHSGGFTASTEPPMVAIYTAHRKSDGLESQCLSISTNHTMFDYYHGNPVLDIRSKSFRDPDVFWHSPSQRWIMVVALPDERKVNFYASTNLKSWQYLSQFGPTGAHEQVWEVPNLFQLPLNGDTNDMKWVLICGMGPNKEQFFVGNFNGTNFVVDARCGAFLREGAGMPGHVFADFESTNYNGWSVEGTAFGTGPCAGGRPRARCLGTRFACSSQGDKAATGRLVSNSFLISDNCINFLIGGRHHPGQTCVNLLVDGTVVRSATGDNSDVLKWSGWEVTEFRDRSAQLEILDIDQGSQGWVGVDHILFSGVLMDFGREHANWIDWGPDFYATRAYRDQDNGGRIDCWLGWMGNWEYAREVPTAWGRGAQSIPRAIRLLSTTSGYSILQSPWPQLAKLRGARVMVENQTIQGTELLREFQPLRNTYELEAIFKLETVDQEFGLNLCVGGGNEVVVGYDTRTSQVYLDRRLSGNVSFSSLFPRRVSAPLLDAFGDVRFHIFVDQSSVEVFVNNGKIVMTALIFPDPASTGLEVFSVRGKALLRRAEAWQMSSIWNQVDSPESTSFRSSP